MTYCIGWKSKTAAFLTGDSALTSTFPAFWPSSSFGELHPEIVVDPLSPRMSVQEAALKVVRFGDSLVTFSGDLGSGMDVLTKLRSEFERTDDPYEAVGRTVADESVRSAAVKIQLLVASFFGGEPRLVSFNLRDGHSISDEDDVVQIGNPLYEHRCRTEVGIRGYLSHNREVVTDRIVLAAAILQAQAYGTQTLTLNHGYGGAFSGGYVDQSGVHWQPDFLFVFHDATEGSSKWGVNGLVSSYIRDESLILVSADQARVFRTRPRPEWDGMSVVELGEQINADNERLFYEEIERGVYDFIGFLSVVREDATLVEMRRCSRHPILELKITESEAYLRYAKELTEILSTPHHYVKFVLTTD